jgi:transposase-like protein
MDMQSSQPNTLLEAIKFFDDPDACQGFMVAMRWPDGVIACPNCGRTEPRYIATRRLFECKEKHAKRQFSVKVGTIFEDSPISLSKWLPALWLIANDKNGISSYELGRALGVTQTTAWFMLHRIRLAMQSDEYNKLDGIVEVDETFIGGKARFMHKDKRAEKIKGTGGMGKVAVMGLLDRHGPDGHSVVQTTVVRSRKRAALATEVRKRVKKGSAVMSDALKSYDDLRRDYNHGVIDHAEKYVDGQVHTNGIENFWSLLKRALKGTYVSVEPFHLFRYLDEEVFRFNNRQINDGERFVRLAHNVIGRRLTFKELIGRGL